MPFTVFHNFADIHKTVQEIVGGKTTLNAVAAAGHKLAEKDLKEHGK